MSTLTINLTNVQPLDTILTGLSGLAYSGNAGLYIKVNATADGFEFAAAGAGGSTFADNAFRVYDSVDNTKILAFEASGITTGTTRTLTVPDASGTIALTSDLSSYLPLSGGTLTGALTISNVAEGLIVSTSDSKAAIKLNSNNYTQILGNGSELNISTLGTTKITFTTNSVQRASISTSGLFIIGAAETSAGVALKRSSTELQVRLADDSAFAPIQASQLTISAGNIITDTTTGMKIGTATSQKLGFWNATPVVQQTTLAAAAAHTSVGGTSLESNDTFGGYTIGQIVTILKSYGFLA